MTDQAPESPLTTLAGAQLGDMTSQKSVLENLLSTACAAKEAIYELESSISVDVKEQKKILKKAQDQAAEVMKILGVSTTTVPDVGKITTSNSTKYSVDDADAWKAAVKILPELLDSMTVSLKPKELEAILTKHNVPVSTLVENSAIKSYNAEKVTITPSNKD